MSRRSSGRRSRIGERYRALGGRGVTGLHIGTSPAAVELMAEIALTAEPAR